LSLVPEEKTSVLDDELYKQLRAMPGGNDVSFRQSWALVIGDKAGFAAALQKAAAALQKAAEIADSTTLVPEGVSFFPGEPPLKDGVISSRGFGELASPKPRYRSDDPIEDIIPIKHGNLVVLLNLQEAKALSEAQWEEALRLWIGVGKIDAIKFIRENTGYGIKESKDLAEDAFKGILSYGH